jgi:hypothetical protein
MTRSDLIQQAHAGRPPRVWRAIVGTIAAFVVALVLTFLVTAPLALATAPSGGTLAQVTFQVATLTAVIGLGGGVLLWVQVVEQRPWHSIGIKTPKLLIK